MAAGRLTTTKYDLNGNPWWTVGSDNVITVTGYDDLDRQEWVLEAAGTNVARQTFTEYDAVGNVKLTTDGVGVKTAYGYDKLNRLTTVTEAAGTSLQRTTIYEYDEVGRKAWEWAPRLFGKETINDLANPALSRVGTKYEYDDSRGR